MAAERWEYGWQWRGACRGRDANLFFPPSHLERAEVKRGRERAAKAICGGCPVQVECLDYSLRTREPYGVWGGLTEMERRRVLRDLDLATDPAESL